MSTATASTAPASTSPHPRRALFVRMFAGLVLLLLLVRLLLPWLLERAVNRRLSELPDHFGVIESLDLRLYRGAYRIHGLSIRHAGEGEAPLFSARTIDFSLAWRELLRGRVVSDIVLDRPILLLSRTEPAPEEDDGWRELVDDLFPIEITRLVVRDGSFDYADATRDPAFSLALEAVNARAEGLANRLPPPGEDFPARAELSARFPGGGLLHVRARGSPLEEPPRMELHAEIDDLHLPALNPFLRASLGVDVSAGSLHVAAEFATADGLYEGYVKPLVRGADFRDVGHEPGGPLKSLWETLVAGATALLTNRQTDQVGTQVPFSGSLDDTRVGRWDAFVTLLRNAFVRALREGVDESVAELEA
jgi:hypothetical protein